MKKILVLLSLLFVVAIVTAQTMEMRTKLIYNPIDCRYEVYATPSASAPSFNMGGSQIVIAVPHDSITIFAATTRRSAFAITTVMPSTTNSWVITAYADKDLPGGTYSGQFDYYAVDNNGGPLGAITANQEILLFHFKLGKNCIDGLRLWEGVGADPNAYFDPKYPAGGGDFQTNISEILPPPSTQPAERWVGNIGNIPTLLSKPTVSIAALCDTPAPGFNSIVATTTGGDNCNPYQYQWSTTGTWLIAPGTSNTGYVAVCPPVDYFYVTVTDANGCVSTDTFIGTPTPVEFLLFTVTKDNNDAVLYWSTTMEVNNNYFDVEHSTDAENFVKVGQVFSKNSNSTAVLNYDFRHKGTVKGVNYYRLKQVDFDGSFEYTDIRSVVFGGSGGLTIYPNPTTDFLLVEMPLGIDNNIIVEVINPAGQIVRSIQNPAHDNKLLSLNVKDIALGYYFIQIRTKSDVYREQFVITK